MSTPPARTKLIGLCVIAAVTGVAIAAGSSDSAGFGVVRDVERTAPPKTFPGVQEQLARLHQAIRIGPDQEAAWNGFAAAMLELDLLTRTFEAEAYTRSADQAGERARHALMFGVALSDMDAALSAEQSAILRDRASALGSAFVCKGLAKGGET
jgi:hypothetical protein